MIKSEKYIKILDKRIVRDHKNAFADGSAEKDEVNHLYRDTVGETKKGSIVIGKRSDQ